MKTKHLVLLGITIPIVFWITLFICSSINNNYNHHTDLVSELGAIDTPSQTLFTLGLVLCSILSVLFVIGLFRVCRLNNISIIPVLLILTYSFSIAGAGLFPLPTKMHGILGAPSILLILSPFIALLLWSNKNKLGIIRLMSVLCFLVMGLGFLVFFPDVLSNFRGLKQRFFHMGWSIWFIYLSLSFLILSNQRTNSH